jgi:hypothetical protein
MIIPQKRRFVKIFTAFFHKKEIIFQKTSKKEEKAQKQ